MGVHYRGCGWQGYNEVAQGESNAEQSDEGPYLEVPDEAEAESPKPEIEGWEKKSLNATSLEPSTSGWGRQFCAAHHVGYFCNGFTRVRCCRNTWGFARCGSTVHYRGCGWHRPGWHHWNEAPEAEGSAYLEEPSEADAENPKPEIKGWENSTSLEASASWGGAFCTAHHVGYFCNGFTRVRCCRNTW